MILSLYAIGAILENKSWSKNIETIRLVILPVFMYYLLVFAEMQTSIQWTSITSSFFALLSMAYYYWATKNQTKA
jgi:hypothetical protein